MTDNAPAASIAPEKKAKKAEKLEKKVEMKKKVQPMAGTASGRARAKPLLSRSLGMSESSAAPKPAKGSRAFSTAGLGLFLAQRPTLNSATTRMVPAWNPQPAVRLSRQTQLQTALLRSLPNVFRRFLR